MASENCMKPFDLNLSDDDYLAFADLVYQKAGINLHRGKKEMVRARLAKRFREGGFSDFQDYYQFVVKDETGDELVQLLDAIVTNLTSFFREDKHFQFMAEYFLPELIASHKKSGGKRNLRIWSAGCSTGEEVYSIVVTVYEHTDIFTFPHLKVLGTDLSTKVLRTAQTGVYPAECLEGIPYSIQRKYFQKGHGRWQDYYRVKDEIKRPAVFRRLNLIESWPFKNNFDLIFCRNVMIYFDRETKSLLVDRLYRQLAPGGYLFIGHSESLTGINNTLKYVQPTIYRK